MEPKSESQESNHLCESKESSEKKCNVAKKKFNYYCEGKELDHCEVKNSVTEVSQND